MRCVLILVEDNASKLSHIFIIIPQGMEDGTVSALHKIKQKGTMIILHIRAVV